MLFKRYGWQFCSPPPPPPTTNPFSSFQLYITIRKMHGEMDGWMGGWRDEKTKNGLGGKTKKKEKLEKKQNANVWNKLINVRMKDGSVNKDQQMKRLKPQHKDAASKTQRGKNIFKESEGWKRWIERTKMRKKQINSETERFNLSYSLSVLHLNRGGKRMTNKRR